MIVTATISCIYDESSENLSLLFDLLSTSASLFQGFIDGCCQCTDLKYIRETIGGQQGAKMAKAVEIGSAVLK